MNNLARHCFLHVRRLLLVTPGMLFCVVLVVSVLFSIVGKAEMTGNAFPTQAKGGNTDATFVSTQVICNVVAFVQTLGLPIMTGVILGSSIMAIFGRLAWPAIVTLVVFTAVFFGASKLISKFAAGVSGISASAFECKGGGATTV